MYSLKLLAYSLTMLLCSLQLPPLSLRDAFVFLKAFRPLLNDDFVFLMASRILLRDADVFFKAFRLLLKAFHSHFVNLGVKV